MFTTISFAVRTGFTGAWMIVRRIGALLMATGTGLLLLALSSCNNGPAPRVVEFQSFGNNDVLQALIDPNGTEVRKVQFEFGRRPSLQHAQAILWTEDVDGYRVDRNEYIVGADPPFTGSFRANYMFEQEWQLEDGEIVDYHVLIHYRRPGDTTDWKYWGRDQYFVAHPTPERPSNRCDLEYRRSTGPLEEDANMPTESMHCFAIKMPEPGVPPAEWRTFEAVFITGWSHQGVLRDWDTPCSQFEPCYGSHGRLLRNVGVNRLHIEVVEPILRRIRMEPGEEVSIRADISKVTCEKIIDPDEFLRAFCRGQPTSEICADVQD